MQPCLSSDEPPEVQARDFLVEPGASGLDTPQKNDNPLGESTRINLPNASAFQTSETPSRALAALQADQQVDETHFKMQQEADVVFEESVPSPTLVNFKSIVENAMDAGIFPQLPCLRPGTLHSETSQNGRIREFLELIVGYFSALPQCRVCLIML